MKPSKRLFALACVAVVLAAASTANAIEVTDPAQGALQMKLRFDLDGSATLTNIGAAPFDIDIYEIHSAGGLLDPVGWYSINDAVIMDVYAVIAALGAPALTFGEFTAQTSVLAEGNISGFARFQPGAPWGIGKPSTAPSVSDLEFWYTRPGYVHEIFLGVVEVVPEPATLALLALGALALIRRRHGIEQQRTLSSSAILSVALCILGLVQVCRAQDYNWVGAGTGGKTGGVRTDPSTLWTVSSNWDPPTVPTGGNANALFWLTNSGTVYAPAGYGGCHTLSVDGTSDEASLRFDEEVVEFSASHLGVGSTGTGEIQQTAGYVQVGWGMYLGGDATGKGTYRLSGGQLRTSEYGLDVGHSGEGHFIHTGGTYTAYVYEVILGRSSTGVGYYTLSGDGVLTAETFGLGDHGAGYYTQIGGSASIALLRLGSCYDYPGGPGYGEASLSGGSTSVGQLNVGSGGANPGEGRLRIQGAGATVTVGNLLYFTKYGNLQSEIRQDGLTTIQALGNVTLNGVWTVLDDGAGFGRFSVIEAANGFTGNFASVVLPNYDDWSYGITGTTLWVEHIPEPATLGLVSVSGMLLLKRRRKPTA